jgi:hypothetical protein
MATATATLAPTMGLLPMRFWALNRILSYLLATDYTSILPCILFGITKNIPAKLGMFSSNSSNRGKTGANRRLRNF